MIQRRPRRNEFEDFVGEVEPRLRRALVAAYGTEPGRDATAVALAWAWRNWSRVQEMDNPAGYLFRVGQSHAGRSLRSRWRVRPERATSPADPWIEPSLLPALAELTMQQRTAVVLCHGLQWTHREVAELLEISPTTVQNHVQRGLDKLRTLMKVNADA